MNTQEFIELPTTVLLDVSQVSSIVIESSRPLTSIVLEIPESSPTCTQCVECSICLDCLRCISAPKIVLPCSHEFHDSCIQTWLETKNTCPICRMNIKAEERPPETGNPGCITWRNLIKYVTCLSIFLIFIFCVKIL